MIVKSSAYTALENLVKWYNRTNIADMREKGPYIISMRETQDKIYPQKITLHLGITRTHDKTGEDPGIRVMVTRSLPPKVNESEYQYKYQKLVDDICIEAMGQFMTAGIAFMRIRMGEMKVPKKEKTPPPVENTPDNPEVQEKENLLVKSKDEPTQSAKP